MKRLFLILTAVTLVLGLVWLGCQKQPPTTPEGEQEQASLGKAAGGPEFAPGRVLAEFSPQADVPGIYQRYGVSEIGEIPDINVIILSVPENAVEKVVAALNRNPNVVFAEPDYTYHAVEIPNDFHFSKQWGLNEALDHDIDAPEAWDVTTGSSADKIAVLDTGADQDHEDLVSKIVANRNFTNSTTVDDIYGHGTHVAGIAAAATNNDKIGIAGTAPACGIMNGKVLGDDGGGYASWIASGMSWATSNGARVINMSLGSLSASRTMQKAVRDAWNKGAVVVAAAGNYSTNMRFYPAAYSQCIAVAATNQSDLKASFSNYGSWVDVAGPGVEIFSTLPNHPYEIQKSHFTDNDYDYLGGTSMASPFVAGIAALVWSTSYGTSNQSVRDRIESTCDVITGTGTYWTYGRVNAHNAVMGSPPPPPPPPTIDVTVLGVIADDIPKSGIYNITAKIKNEGTDPVTIHVECKVQTPNGRGRKQNLTVKEVTVQPGELEFATVTWDDPSTLNKGSYVAVVTVQEDSDVGLNNRSNEFLIY